MTIKLKVFKVTAYAEIGKDCCWVGKEIESNKVRGYFNEESDAEIFVEAFNQKFKLN